MASCLWCCSQRRTTRVPICFGRPLALAVAGLGLDSCVIFSTDAHHLHQQREAKIAGDFLLAMSNAVYSLTSAVGKGHLCSSRRTTLAGDKTRSRRKCQHKPVQSLLRPDAASSSNGPRSAERETASAAVDQNAMEEIHQCGFAPSRREVIQSTAAAAAAGVAGVVAPPRSVASTTTSSGGSSVESLVKKLTDGTTEFTLPNGLTFLVHERHSAPIVSCRTYAAVGAFDEADGSTGIAHLLEHMAFKGTPQIGTRDFKQEAPLLDAMDEVFYELRALKNQAPYSDAGKSEALERRLGELQRSARELQIPNHFGAILNREGAVGLNAATSQDSTQYFVNLPANKLELWMAMEAERFRAPVFRELYTEKKVVLEERSARVEQAPLGRYFERFQSDGFLNNYRRPTIGYREDIQAIGRAELKEFFQSHYGPGALTIAIVGDVDPDQVYQMAERYFGPWSAPKAMAPSISCGSGGYSGIAAAGGASAAGPVPNGEQELWWQSDAGPLVMDGYYHKRPINCSNDAVVLGVICDLLYGTRSSRLYRSLVESNQALSCSVLDTYPAEKFPSMAVTYAVPSPGVDIQDCAAAMRAQVEALSSGDISQAELARVKKGYRIDALEALSRNSALASILASSQGLTGNWQRAVRELEYLEDLKASDIQSFAGELFRPENRFSGYVAATGQPRPAGKIFAN